MVMAKGRRPSAASVAGGFLFPPGDGGHQSLNPDSAFPPGFSRERRRNSYAAGVPIPELLVQSPEMSPTLAQQLAPGHQGQYGSQHLLAPSGSFRRRLPPTPLDLANGRLSGSNETLPADDGPIRRTSSPRVLPTPPPPQQLQAFSPTGQSSSTSPPSWSNGSSPQPFERRRSIRRQLPPEPVHHQQSQPQFDLNHKNFPNEHFESADNKLAINGMVGPNSILQRSSSTRSARRQSNRTAHLPPVPRQQQSLEADNTIANACAAASTMPPCAPRLSRTASAAVNTSMPAKRRSLTAVGPTESMGDKAAAANKAMGNNNVAAVANGQQPTSTTTIILTNITNTIAKTTNPAAGNSTKGGIDGSCNSAATTTIGIAPAANSSEEPAANVPLLSSSLTPPPPHPPPTFVSAPTSPRDQPAAAAQAHGGSPVRKYSSDSPSVLNDLVAISSLNLKRNGSGSMAHLLEQQHILRREFTATPAANGEAAPNPAAAGMAGGSNSSSLSPSIEQLNCTVASRSGSDAEIVADPSVLGFDPSLYTNDPSAGSSHCSGSAHSIHSASLPSEPTTSGEDLPQPRGLGLLHCTLQHFPVRKRLRVNVLKIEGLAGELRPDLEIQPFCKLTLTPGKKQQQQSVVKRGRDVVFNQEFFFDAIASEDIESKHLQIEVCHSSAQKLQKDLDIGEARIPLRDLTEQLHSKKEVRIVEELKLFSARKKLGRLHISTCIEKEARRLTINLAKAEDLPKWGIIGAPDVQIRIKMQQGSGQEVVKSSRVLKNTTTAVYKEAVMFLISTKEADLARTKITISVHDLSRSVTGNDVIGSVYLGELALDKSEIDQWRSTMDHWGKEYKGVHALKGPGQTTPDVHVLDVQEEADD